MVGERLAAYRGRVRDGLRAAFSEDHPPKTVASTFSFGVFVSALPNLGIALVLFALLAHFIERVSKLALIAAVVVMNPPVKWAVYAVSYWLGSRILGPVPDTTVAELSLSSGPDVAVRLLVGNVLIAIVIATVGYVAALRFVETLRQQDVDIVETLPGTSADETR